MTYSRVLFLAAGLVWAAATSAQQSGLPETFTSLKQSGSFEERLQIAFKEARAKGERKFWVGYRFELNRDIDFHSFYMHEDGVTIYRDSGMVYHVGRHGRHSKEGTSGGRAAIISGQAGGLFLLYDTDARTVDRIRMHSIYETDGFREWPVFWLGDVETDQSFNLMKAFIENENAPLKVAESAVFALSLHEHPEVISCLVETSRRKNMDGDVRENAVFWLGQIPGEESFAAVVDLYRTLDDRDLREKAIFAISQHESEKVVPELLRIAKSDAHHDLREKAIFWLGQRDGDESLKQLEGLLKSDLRRSLQEKVIFSISQQESDRAIDLLIDVAYNNRDRELREKAIFWLGQKAGKKTLEALGDIVQDDETIEIKEKAIFAISQHEDTDEAISMLMEIARNNPNAELRKKAMFWLGQTGDERALDFFREVLTKN